MRTILDTLATTAFYVYKNNAYLFTVTIHFFNSTPFLFFLISLGFGGMHAHSKNDGCTAIHTCYMEYVLCSLSVDEFGFFFSLSVPHEIYHWSDAVEEVLGTTVLTNIFTNIHIKEQGVDENDIFRSILSVAVWGYNGLNNKHLSKAMFGATVFQNFDLEIPCFQYHKNTIVFDGLWYIKFCFLKTNQTYFGILLIPGMRRNL
ncbi:hypothetical protein ACJX0J_017484, partial [Zea mays]